MIARPDPVSARAELDELKTKKGEKNGVFNILNFQKNWLKHLSVEDFTSYSNPKKEASYLIERAVINFSLLGNESTSTIQRFNEVLQNES